MPREPKVLPERETGHHLPSGLTATSAAAPLKWCHAGATSQAGQEPMDSWSCVFNRGKIVWLRPNKGGRSPTILLHRRLVLVRSFAGRRGRVPSGQLMKIFSILCSELPGSSYYTQGWLPALMKWQRGKGMASSVVAGPSLLARSQRRLIAPRCRFSALSHRACISCYQTRQPWCEPLTSPGYCGP